MEKQNHLYIICIGLLLLWVGNACSSGTDDPVETPVPPAAKEKIQFAVSLNGISMTKTDLDGTAFTEGDAFTIYFDYTKPQVSSVTNNVSEYSLSSGEWDSDDPLYWDDYAAETKYFCAVSPFPANYTVAESGNTDLFSVQEDQSTEAYLLASDLLISRVKTEVRLVPLPFHHVLSKVRVNISASTKTDDPNGWFTEDDFEDMTVELTGMYAKGNILYENITGSNGAGITVSAKTEDENEVDITMLPSEGNPVIIAAKDSIRSSFVAIIPPRATFSANEMLLRIQLSGDDGKTYFFKPKSTVDFTKQGYQTILNVELQKQDVLAELDTDIELVDWVGGATATEDDDNPITLK